MIQRGNESPKRVATSSAATRQEGAAADVHYGPFNRIYQGATLPTHKTRRHLRYVNTEALLSRFTGRRGSIQDRWR